MRKRERISVEDKKGDLGNNPFADLDFSGVKVFEKEKQFEDEAARGDKLMLKKRGRVGIRCEKSGRKGKIVTVLEGIKDNEERRNLLKMIQKKCASGGTIKGEVIEIQGDKREEITKVLKEDGYRF